MREEIFGPVLSIYVYKDNKVKETLNLIGSTTSFALTGAIFAQDEYVFKIGRIFSLRNSLSYLFR